MRCDFATGIHSQSEVPQFGGCSRRSLAINTARVEIRKEKDANLTDGILFFRHGYHNKENLFIASSLNTELAD